MTNAHLFTCFWHLKLIKGFHDEMREGDGDGEERRERERCIYVVIMHKCVITYNPTSLPV